MQDVLVIENKETYVRVKCMKNHQAVADHVENGEEQPEGEKDTASVYVLLLLVQGQHEGDHLERSLGKKCGTGEKRD